jgi:hypothetical protein
MCICRISFAELWVKIAGKFFHAKSSLTRIEAQRRSRPGVRSKELKEYLMAATPSADKPQADKRPGVRINVAWE